ncbi:hypothetical protein [Burkholderia stabilis]
MNKLTAQVASVMDRENLIYEIWLGNKQVAEISKEPGCDYSIEIYANEEGAAWNFDLKEFQNLIDLGVTSLAENK